MSLEEILPEEIEVERHYFEWRGMKIAYLDQGAGETFVCLPGWPSSSLLFLPLYYALGKKIRLISIDLPGWGGLSDNNPDVSQDLFLELIDHLLAKLKLEKFSLIGYSYGGMLSQHVASQHHEQIERLILISPPANLDLVTKDSQRSLKVYQWLLNTHLPGWIPKHLLRYLLLADFFRVNPYFYLRNHNYFKACLQDSCLLSARGVLNCVVQRCQLQPAYYKLRRLPVTLIQAAHEPTFVRQSVSLLSQKLKIRPLTIPNTDHGHVWFELLNNRRQLRRALGLTR